MDRSKVEGIDNAKAYKECRQLNDPLLPLGSFRNKIEKINEQERLAIYKQQIVVQGIVYTIT